MGRAFFWILAVGIFASARPVCAKELRGAWNTLLPYQYEERGVSGLERPAGFDIEVFREVARGAGFHAVFREEEWSEALESIREGRIDFALGATPEESRADWAWFTEPYRKESIVLFVRSRAASPEDGKGRWKSFEQFLREGGSLAVTRSFYYGPEPMERIAEAAAQGRILETSGDEESLAKLLSGEVDGFLADRLSAASVASQAEALPFVELVPGIIYEADVSLMFSKKTVTEAEFRRLDESLAELRESGELDRIGRHHLLPHLVLITKQAVWFRLFDAIGTVAFAISGVLIARRERYDIVGACVLAALPAVGGGVIRDLVTGRSPIAILESPDLLLLVLGTVLAGWLFYTVHDRFFPDATSGGGESGEDRFRWMSTRGALEIFDAIGLSTFMVVGVMVAMVQNCEPLWLWGPLLAAITAAGGGVLRDVLRSQSDIPTLKGSIYPEIALVWGLVYSIAILVLGMDLGLETTLALTITVMAAAFATRILVVQFDIPSIFLGSRPRVEI